MKCFRCPARKVIGREDPEEVCTANVPDDRKVTFKDDQEGCKLTLKQIKRKVDIPVMVHTKKEKHSTFQLCEKCAHEFDGYVIEYGSVYHPNRLCEACGQPATTIDARMAADWIHMMYDKRKDIKHETRSIPSDWRKNIFNRR